MRRSRRYLIGLAAALCATLGAVQGALACGSGGYSYAGLASDTDASGIAATITPLPAFSVASGHVAGWVGVGGRDEWLQVGVSAFPGVSDGELYYEAKVPTSGAVYHRIASGLPTGRAAHVAVVELRARPNYWRVWVDATPASRPILLPASHGRWRPVATAESWNDAGSVCNTFLFRFRDLALARRPGGTWRPLVDWAPISRGPARIERSRSGFLVGSGDHALLLMTSLTP